MHGKVKMGDRPPTPKESDDDDDFGSMDPALGAQVASAIREAAAARARTPAANALAAAARTESSGKGAAPSTVDSSTVDLSAGGAAPRNATAAPAPAGATAAAASGAAPPRNGDGLSGLAVTNHDSSDDDDAHKVPSHKVPPPSKPKPKSAPKPKLAPKPKPARKTSWELGEHVEARFHNDKKVAHGDGAHKNKWYLGVCCCAYCCCCCCCCCCYCCYCCNNNLLLLQLLPLSLPLLLLPFFHRPHHAHPRRRSGL